MTTCSFFVLIFLIAFTVCQKIQPFDGEHLAIQSARSPTNWLRMDGIGCGERNGPGGCGQVNTQYYPIGIVPSGGYEDFVLHQNSDGRTWCIISHLDPAVYLRLDGSGCSAPGMTCGPANAQWTLPGLDCEEFTTFDIRSSVEGGFTIESVTFPGVFLSMNATGCTEFEGLGCGTVGGEFGIGNGSVFNLAVLVNNQTLEF